MARHHDNRSQLSGSSVLVGERELATLNAADGLLTIFSIVAVGLPVVVSLFHDDQVLAMAETVMDEGAYHENDGAVDSFEVTSYAVGMSSSLDTDTGCRRFVKVLGVCQGARALVK